MPVWKTSTAVRTLLSKSGDYARAAQEMGPRLFLTKALRKAGISTPALQRTEVLADRRQMQPGRLATIYGAYETRAAGEFGWQPIDFDGKRVLEIGAGSLGGLAPLALVDGAASYAGIDPAFDPSVFGNRRVQQRFLPETLDATARLRGKTSAPTVADLRARCSFLKTPLEKLDGKEPADVVVSISCLEHIWDFDAALAALKPLTHDATRHFHIVNFGNHRNRNRPFDGLYHMTPDRYETAYGRSINLWRMPDMAKAFLKAGFDVACEPFDLRPDAVPTDADDWWTERYDHRVLGIRTGLIFNA